MGTCLHWLTSDNLQYSLMMIILWYNNIFYLNEINTTPEEIRAAWAHMERHLKKMLLSDGCVQRGQWIGAILFQMMYCILCPGKDFLHDSTM